MKKASKKLAGGFMVVMLIATIGTVIASSADDETTEDDTKHTTFWGFWGRGTMRFGSENLFYELTDEQEEEIMQIKETMIDEGATCEEIREAIMQKLDEYGILDKRLDNAIEQTQQRLKILERQKELRAEGKTWEEINEIIQEEFELEFPDGEAMMSQHGFRRGFCGGPRSFMSEE
ncbi:MAG: hypothetical protein ACFFBV_15130 [Promethearchaeota archaeon]